MATESNPEAKEKVEKVDYVKVAKIAFVEKGKDKPFKFVVYENGTIVSWLDNTLINQVLSSLDLDEIIQTANKQLEKFPGFTPGTPDADFRVIHNKGMFGDLPEKVYLVTYEHRLPYMSCIIGDMSELEAGLKARENLEKDAREQRCMYVGYNPPLDP